MWSNMVASLVEHGRIKTTEAKAKELRRIAEKTITWATSLGDILTTERDKLTADERSKLVHHVRMAKRVLRDKDTLKKLFDEVGPQLVGRPGGYTRIIRHYRFRHGDNAAMAYIEILGQDEVDEESEEKAQASEE